MKGGKSKADSGRTDAALKTKRASKKVTKDPNKPKRPSSAFFVFMEEFRQQFKKSHPNNKSVAAVGKAGGERWKQMSEEEKAPFVGKAEKRKAEYEKNLAAYEKRKNGGNADDESDKSKSEVNDEDDQEESGDEEEDDD